MQESIGEVAESQEVPERADQLRRFGYASGFLIICPVSGDPRLTAVGQEDHELQAGAQPHLSEDCQRLAFEGMMQTRDSDAFGEVLMMGSLSYAPSTIFRTNGP